MKVFKFPQPDGSVLVMTQISQDPPTYSSQYENGTTIADKIADLFAAGAIKK